MNDYEGIQLEIVRAYLAPNRKGRREWKRECDVLLSDLEEVNLRWDGEGHKPRCNRSTLRAIARIQRQIGSDFESPKNTIAAHDQVLMLQEAFMLTIPGDVFEREEREWQVSAAV